MRKKFQYQSSQVRKAMISKSIKGRPRDEIVTKSSMRDLEDDDTTVTGSTSSADEERIIYFTGDVSEASVSQAIAAMFAMSKKDRTKPIYLVIETYGGSVDSMFSLYDAMKFVPCPVHTIALGKVMSAGVLILAAGRKGERLIAPHARVMTHPAWGYIAGNVFELKNELLEMERQEKQWATAMSHETGMTLEKLNEINQRRGDQYLTPHECIELGIADKLLYEHPTALRSTSDYKKKEEVVKKPKKR